MNSKRVQSSQLEYPGKPIIVFCYLKNSLPKYALQNIIQTAKKFPDKRIVIISDIPQLKLSRFSKSNIEIFLTPKLEVEWAKVDKKLKHPKNFRGNFWFATIARFKAIELFMISNPTNAPVFHFEADVWISHGFPFGKIEKIEKQLAYTLPSDSEGSAAFLYVRDFDSIQKLVDISERLIESDGSNTDMTILRKIYDQKLMQVQILPSNPLGEDFNNSELKRLNLQNDLFDPSTWGMYLFGTDPRNSRGWSRIRSEEAHHFIKPSKYRFQISDNRIYAKPDGQFKYELNNLHIHSKSSSFFKEKDIPNKIVSFIEDSSSGPKSIFFWDVFIFQLVKSVFRRFSKFKIRRSGK